MVGGGSCTRPDRPAGPALGIWAVFLGEPVPARAATLNPSSGLGSPTVHGLTPRSTSTRAVNGAAAVDPAIEGAARVGRRARGEMSSMCSGADALCRTRRRINYRGAVTPCTCPSRQRDHAGGRAETPEDR